MVRQVLTFLLVASAAGPVTSHAQRVVHRVPVTGTIELGIAPFIQRALDEAAASGAAAVVLDINTLGGRVDAALNIVDAVTRAEIPVYAFVNPRAISAGALIAVSTDSVFITNEGHMGASTVVDASGTKVSEKAQSVMRAQFRALAERRGLDPRIGEAMVDETIAIDGVVEEGKLLTLTASEAEKVGYAVEVRDFDDLLARLGFVGVEIVTPSLNWAEQLVRFLSHPLVSPLLLSLGVLGLMIEIKTPSFGVAGAVGLVSLAAFFGSHLIVGLAGLEEIILLAVGLVALLIEVFVIPGFGLAGFVAIIAIGAAAFLALLGALPTWADVARASGILLAAGMIVSAVAYFFVRHLPSSNRWRGVFLRAVTDKTAGYISGDARQELVGQLGIALTDLRPSGTARIGQERVDVVAEGGFVDKDQRVRVVRAESYRLVVEAVEERPPA